MVGKSIEQEILVTLTAAPMGVRLQKAIERWRGARRTGSDLGSRVGAHARDERLGG